jgi:hypothetical protein
MMFLIVSIMVIYIFQLGLVVACLNETDIFKTKRKLYYWLIPIIPPIIHILKTYFSLIYSFKRLFTNIIKYVKLTIYNFNRIGK